MHLLWLFSLLACSSYCGASNGGGRVIELSANAWRSDLATKSVGDALEEFISRDSSPAYVYFYTPYSSHCKIVTPLYEEATAYLSVHNPRIRLAIIHCNDVGDLCGEQSVRSFPILREYHGVPGSFKDHIGSGLIPEHLFELTNGTVARPSPPPTRPKPPVSSVAPTVPNPSPDSAAPNAVYLYVDGSTAIVKLNVPGAPLESTRSVKKDSPSSIFLNFTISADRRHLLLNDELFALLVPNPSVPPRLQAPQRAHSASWDDLTRAPTSPPRGPQHRSADQTLGLDYELDMNNRDDPSISYYNYHPVLRVNIIGVRRTRKLSGGNEPHYLLDGTNAQGSQKVVEIQMREQNYVSSTSPRRNFTITAVKFLDRPADYVAPRGPRPCSTSSWRCADIADPPWYSQVWYSHFDEYGRVGCLRRVVARCWDAYSPVGLYVLFPAWVALSAWKAWRRVSRRKATWAGGYDRKRGILA